MISLAKYMRETWSATPALGPVGAVRPGYQNVIDKNLRMGDNTITLLRNKGKKKMISISELMPNPYQAKTPIETYGARRLPGGKAGITVNMKPANQRTPGVMQAMPNKNRMLGMNIGQLRQQQNVSPVTGQRISSTGLAMMGRKAPPETGQFSVKPPLRRPNVPNVR